MTDRFDIRMETAPDLAGIGPLLDAVGHYLAGQGASDALRRRAMLAVEELVANAIMHGALSPDQRITTDMTLGPAHLHVRIAYPGPAFDSAAPAGPRDDPGDSPGGHGLFLVQSIAGHLAHSYRDGFNIHSLDLPRDFPRDPAT